MARPVGGADAPAPVAKLDDGKARLFAIRIHEAIQLVSQEYAREVEEADLATWAIEALYRRAEVPVPKSIQERLETLGEEDDTPLELLTDARKQLGVRPKLDGQHDIAATLSGMLARLDVRSVYVDPKKAARNRKFSVNATSQVGVFYAPDKKTGRCRIVGTIKDGPAYRAGVRHGDWLLEVHLYENADGKGLAEPRAVAVKGLAALDMEDLLAGRPGARVDLVIQRDSLERALTFALQYEILRIETVLGFKRKADDSWDYVADAERRIAYVRIAQFYGSHTSRDLEAVVSELTEAKMKGLILDLRGNPGGRITQGVSVCELLAPQGVVVGELQGRGTNAGKIWAKRPDPYTELPIVCLVDHETASTAEVVAACLQDHRRVTILGERTFGKGSMQVYYPFHGGELRLTSAYFLRPSGDNLDREHLSNPKHQRWGVTPEKMLVLSDKEYADLQAHLVKKTMIREPHKDGPYRDPHVEAALELLREKAKR